MDSPSQVYHQLTDPLDEPDDTDLGVDQDEDYIDKGEDEEHRGEGRVRGPQKQNHRKTFKVGLWDAMNDPAFHHLICWSADGTSGEIPDKFKFQNSHAMRAITDAKDFGGFVRQLHMWGFKRSSVDGRSCAFYHESFRRGRLDLLEQIKRKGERKVARVPAVRVMDNWPPP
ncbi:winged helix DNA-binding domain-containing protein [Cutaneotrichosporon oleaginosum]|uniref:Winged helix DNA-binding domain-containing protein n=1 Tax=Cutaneotrichosporon oleaginosum TaxID=879819 RepID=A0A0J1AY52_9TREE|nr:winged helix DNA-binding domain-containing protein [Cutaneotrichosporon oleaginosum]KLT40259.1 winged helix DNA-binding domain-containing protein [Cutaneotrichosporon oleaginosum]TXT11292.1 hypothetical protein COLE_01702 [Cutaneotrichosporon oleaginosum]